MTVKGQRDNRGTLGFSIDRLSSDGVEVYLDDRELRFDVPLAPPPVEELQALREALTRTSLVADIIVDRAIDNMMDQLQSYTLAEILNRSR